MNKTIDRISENYLRVVANVRDACIAAGRNSDEVTIVGVSKYVDAETTAALVNAGCKVLGESRPQNLWDKAEKLHGLDCQWHMIGHLQRNKLKRTLPLVNLVHSIDSTRLAEAISATAIELGITCTGLLEVNISGDASKHGFSVLELPAVLDPLSKLRGLRIVGLMAMSGLESSTDDARREFAAVRNLRDKIVQKGIPEGLTLKELSMGMSGDYQQAISEGATIVRIGSALFDGIVE